MLPAALICLSTIPAAAAPPVVGFLMIDRYGATVFADWFRDGLRALGHVDGQTLVLEVRGADGNDTLLPALSREILSRNPALIVSTCGPAQRAIRNASRTIPLVSLCAEWANYLGEVASMRRPGSATTGILSLGPDTVGKRLELLKEIQPDLARVAVLHNRVDDWRNYWRETDRSARALGIRLIALPAIERVADVEGALAIALAERAEAVIAFPDATTQGAAKQIAEFAARHRLLSAFDVGAFALEGGLLTYGPDWRDIALHVLPPYVDRILRGLLPRNCQSCSRRSSN